jgi:hypothetical protein
MRRFVFPLASLALIVCLVFPSMAFAPREGMAESSEDPTPLWKAPPLSVRSGNDLLPLERDRGSRPYRMSPRPASPTALDLVNGNFPIANYSDSVSGNTDLDSAVVAWNSQRKVWLVVWHAYGRAHDFDVFGREVSENGATSSPSFPIIQDDGTQGGPVLAYDAAHDQYWLAWVDSSSAPQRIFIQRLSSTGQRLGTPVLASPPDRDAVSPHIACSAQRCLLTFRLGLSDDSAIAARSFDAAGNATSVVTNLSPTGVTVDDPDVAYNSADDQFLLIFSQKQPTTGYDIVGQVLTAACAPVGAPINICSAVQDQSQPRVTYSTYLKLYLAVWTDGRDPDDTDVFGRLLNHAAAPQGEAFQIYAGTYNDHQPSLSAHGTRDQFLVCLVRDMAPYGVAVIEGVTVTGSGAVTGSIIVRSGNNERWFPQVAQHSGSDDYLVTWTTNDTTGETDIFACRVQADRTLNGAAILVCAGRKGQELPGVAYNVKNNRFVVAWQDYHDVSAYDIRGRIVAADGSLPGQEAKVSQSGQGSVFPAVSSLSGRDDALVVWSSFQTNGVQIRARRMTASGQAQGSEVHVSRDVPTHANWGLSIAANPARNEYLVVWSAFADGSYNIYAQRLSADAALLGTNFPVSSAGGIQCAPRVAFNPQAQEYLVVWDDKRSGICDIYGQPVSELGALVGSEIRLTAASSSVGSPSVAWNADRQEYLLVWSQYVEDIFVYGRRLGPAGQPLAAPFAITQSTWNADVPVLGYDSLCHNYLLAWTATSDLADKDVACALLNADGTLAGNRSSVSVHTELQQSAALAQNTADSQFLIVWMDAFAGSWDIYGQRWTNACLPTPTPQPLASPTRTLVPTITATPTRTRTPTRTPVRPYKLSLPIVQ